MSADKLCCKNLDKSFDGNQALDDFSYRFPRTGVIAIVGPNGAGKTTLFDVITGYVRPDAGECCLGEKELTDLPPNVIARLGIARTFQDFHLLPQMPVIDHVRLARSNHENDGLWEALRWTTAKTKDEKTAARAYLERAGLTEQEDSPAESLSFGQRKLLALATCLATEAQILLLDEPLTGTDLNVKERMKGMIRNTMAEKGRLIVMIEHDRSIKRWVDDWIELDQNGRIVDENGK